MANPFMFGLMSELNLVLIIAQMGHCQGPTGKRVGALTGIDVTDIANQNILGRKSCP